jgi:predicted DNA-binding antitoxin AbrB/MazE fold protein
MSIIVEAIYEAGVLKPLEPLCGLKDHALVKLTIEPASRIPARPGRDLIEVLERIDRRRQKIFERNGELTDSAALIREGREQELE